MKIKVKNDTNSPIVRAGYLFERKSDEVYDIPKHKILEIESCVNLQVTTNFEEEVEEDNEENNEEQNTDEGNNADDGEKEETEGDSEVKDEEDLLYSKEELKQKNLDELREIVELNDLNAKYDNDKAQFIDDILEELGSE